MVQAVPRTPVQGMKKYNFHMLCKDHSTMSNDDKWNKIIQFVKKS